MVEGALLPPSVMYFSQRLLQMCCNSFFSADPCFLFKPHHHFCSPALSFVFVCGGMIVTLNKAGVFEKGNTKIMQGGVRWGAAVKTSTKKWHMTCWCRLHEGPYEVHHAGDKSESFPLFFKNRFSSKRSRTGTSASAADYAALLTACDCCWSCLMVFLACSSWALASSHCCLSVATSRLTR